MHSPVQELAKARQFVGCSPPEASATLCLPAEIHGIIARSWAPTSSIGWCLPVLAQLR